MNKHNNIKEYKIYGNGGICIEAVVCKVAHPSMKIILSISEIMYNLGEEEVRKKRKLYGR